MGVPVNRGVSRAARLLTLFSDDRSVLKLSDMAGQLGVPESTTYRYALTLQELGFLDRDTGGGYRLGPRVIELAGIALNQIEAHKHALEEMDELCARVGRLVNLGILSNGAVLLIAHSAPPSVPRMYTEIGRTAAPQCTALGKALLADLPWDAIREILGEDGWKGYTPNSITTPDALRKELEETRRRGYAVDTEERRLGVTCVAAPIRDGTGRVTASLSISGTPEHPGSVHDDERYIQEIRQCANRISYRLGFKGSNAYPSPV